MVSSDRPESSRDPFLGRVIDGRFTIEGVLGRGGMGVVYRAYQASLERSVALKLMTGVPPERAEEFERRFFLEAATAARLKHPNTITVFDYGSSVVDGENLFYITMELLEGVTLSTLLAQGRALPPLRALHIALQICRSLREAHVAGVVHRDLKPGNVMIVKQDDADDVDADFVKVLDFGLAKTRAGDAGRPIEGITKAGTFMGSPRYVAPEQIEGRAVDQRADVYSFGCMLFRMLSGRVPFDGQQPVEIMLKHLREPVPPLGVAGMPLTLERLVTDCLAKEPADRPAGMDEVAHRLKLARAELGGLGSGVISLSDERRAALAEESRAAPSPQARGDAEGSGGSSRRERRRAAPVDVVDERAPGLWDDLAPSQHSERETSETAWKLGQVVAGDDSTRPTRVLQAMRPVMPTRPAAAVALGMVIGLVMCVGLIVWRLGWIEGIRARMERASAAIASAPSSAAAVRGPLAARAQLRVLTTPAGADVLEIVDGLPRLLGLTPMTMEWSVGQRPEPRTLVLRKEGYETGRVTVEPPLRASSGPADRAVWVDVELTLQPLALQAGPPPSTVAGAP